MIAVASTAMHGSASGHVHCWDIYVIVGNYIATELLASDNETQLSRQHNVTSS